MSEYLKKEGVKIYNFFDKVFNSIHRIKTRLKQDTIQFNASPNKKTRWQSKLLHYYENSGLIFTKDLMEIFE